MKVYALYIKNILYEFSANMIGSGKKAIGKSPSYYIQRGKNNAKL